MLWASADLTRCFLLPLPHKEELTPTQWSLQSPVPSGRQDTRTELMLTPTGSWHTGYRIILQTLLFQMSPNPLKKTNMFLCRNTLQIMFANMSMQFICTCQQNDNKRTPWIEDEHEESLYLTSLNKRIRCSCHILVIIKGGSTCTVQEIKPVSCDWRHFNYSKYLIAKHFPRTECHQGCI